MKALPIELFADHTTPDILPKKNSPSITLNQEILLHILKNRFVNKQLRVQHFIKLKIYRAMYKSTIYLVGLHLCSEIFHYLAMVLFNPDMLGAKKYSPPFGVIKTPIEIDFNGVVGSSPIMLLVP